MARPDEAVLIVDDGGRFHYVNAAACALLRSTREELLSRSLRDTCIDDDDIMAAGILKDLRQGKDLHFQRRFRRSDGTSFTADVRWKILDDGRFRAMIQPTGADGGDG